MREVPLPDLKKQEEKKLDEISSDINIDAFASKVAEIGNDALKGKDGPARDSLIYTSALTLSIIKKVDFKDAAIKITDVIKSGKVKDFFYNAK